MYQIMLVEDEALVRESMAQNTNWEKFGFAPPHVFENGRQAADHLETVLPDVVITDICMPFLDGLELAKLVYERFPETIVVVLTGFSEFSYAQKAIRYHVHDYLLKPVSRSSRRIAFATEWMVFPSCSAITGLLLQFYIITIAWRTSFSNRIRSAMSK